MPSSGDWTKSKQLSKILKPFLTDHLVTEPPHTSKNKVGLCWGWGLMTRLPHNERLSWSPGEICVQIYNKNSIYHMNWYLSKSSQCLMVSWSNIVTPLPHNERLSWSPGEICVRIYNTNQFSIWNFIYPKVLVVSWSNVVTPLPHNERLSWSPGEI